MKNASLEKLRPEVVSKAEGEVLEIGFGTGLNIPYYKNISKLYALEPSAELCKFAQERITKAPFPVEFVQASAENIPFAPNMFDVVVSTWSLCSIPKPEVALKEVFRVLKPGGKFVFIEHGKAPIKIIAKLQKWLTPISKRVAGGCNMNREIDKLIAGAGFEMQELEKFQQKSKPLAFMYKGVAVAKK